MAFAMKDLKPDVAYSSILSRAKETLEIMIVDNGWDMLPLTNDAALNERDYGDLTGLSHEDMEKKHGKEQVRKWRRSWDEPVPGGESLKQVYRRVVLYFETNIMPHLRRGNSVLIVAHGNTLRALIKHIDNLDNGQVEQLEMPLEEIIIYNYEIRVTAKQVRKTDVTTLPFVTVNSTYIKE
jgi:2,3-bisphosphoglycerate-dependent phosphoglycerate mutase